jgi:hypothetical protein
MQRLKPGQSISERIEELETENEVLRSDIKELVQECNEQARLNGMGAERELALRAEVMRLTEALKPFADYADPTNRVSGHLTVSAGSFMARRQLTMDDCYKARNALVDKKLTC